MSCPFVQDNAVEHLVRGQHVVPGESMWSAVLCLDILSVWVGLVSLLVRE